MRVKIPYTDHESIIKAAKDLRLIYEYDYMQNPTLAADIIYKTFSQRQLVLYPNTKHTVSIVASLSDLGGTCIVADDEFVFEGADVIVLVGYWNNVGIQEFCDRFNVDRSKLFLPYMEKKLISEAKSVESEIDRLTFSKNLSELLFIVAHEARDFITHSAHELSKHYRLTKVYIGDIGECDANSYFSQVISLCGNSKALEYLFEKHKKNISVCGVFTHGMDFCKVPYIRSMLDEKTKLIALSCDWGWFAHKNINDVSLCAGKSIEYCALDASAEIYALHNADIVVTNRDLSGEISGIDEKTLINFAFVDSSKFVFEKRVDGDIKCCFAGSLPPHKIDGLFGNYFNILNIFEAITKTGITIDVFESYWRNLSAEGSQYKTLIDKGLLIQRETLTQDALPSYLPSYSFGLLLYNFSPEWLSKYQYLMRRLIQGKFITYLAAGIPVVISAEFEVMSDMVRKFGCGIVLKQSDIDNADLILKNADYDSLKEGVLRFQKYYAEHDQAIKLTEFIVNKSVNKYDI